MNKRKILVIMLIAALCCGLLISLASCEPLIWEGAPIGGVITNGVSQIELKSVEYKYSIFDYPKRIDGEFRQTNSYVTATYKYYNPMSSEVTMPLYLETGKPRYDFEKNYNDTWRYEFASIAEYEITLRCVYGRELNNYSSSDNVTRVGNFLKNIYDDKQTDVYYNSELPVYKYTYAIGDLSDNVRSIFLQKNKSDNDVIFFDQKVSQSDSIVESYICYKIDADGIETLTLYSLEKEFTDSLSLRDGANEVVSNGGSITLVEREELTFDDFAMVRYDEESNLSATDWYNAVLARMNTMPSYLKVTDLGYFDMTEMSYMYQCNLVVPAKSEVSLSVVMPLYPTVDGQHYDEHVYEYELDLSALSNWRGTPEVSVSIATNGYYVKSSASFKETATGFELDSVSLSKKNITFTLCDVPDFDKDKNKSDDDDRDDDRRVLIVFLIVIGVIYLVPIITVSVVLSRDRAKRKQVNAVNNDETTTTTKQ